MLDEPIFELVLRFPSLNLVENRVNDGGDQVYLLLE